MFARRQKSTTTCSAASPSSLWLWGHWCIMDPMPLARYSLFIWFWGFRIREACLPASQLLFPLSFPWDPAQAVITFATLSSLRAATNIAYLKVLIRIILGYLHVLFDRSTRLMMNFLSETTNATTTHFLHGVLLLSLFNKHA